MPCTLRGIPLRSSTSRYRFWVMLVSSFSPLTSSWCRTRCPHYGEPSGTSTKRTAARSGDGGRGYENKNEISTGKEHVKKFLVLPDNAYFLLLNPSLTVSIEKVMTSFPRFQGSRPGHFKALRAGDASPLPVPLDFARGQGVPHFVTP